MLFLFNTTTSALFSDFTSQELNTFTAGVIGSSVSDSSGVDLGGSFMSFSSVPPNSTESAELRVINEGNLSQKYDLSLQNVSGDTDICFLLQARILKDGVSVYEGGLVTMPVSTHSSTDLYNEWQFDVWFESSDESLQVKTCEFDFYIESYMDGSLYGTGFFEREVVSNTFSSGDWFDPTSSLAITGSWTKVLSENVTNGGFEAGDTSGWSESGRVVVKGTDTISDSNTTSLDPYEGSYMARIGHKSGSDRNFSFENRLLQSIPEGAKSLSFMYNFFSRDADPFDDPGFFVRINGDQVFSLSAKDVNPTDLTDEVARDTGWLPVTFDLSQYTTDRINLGIYSGNTDDTDVQSFAYIDNVTTYFVAAPSHATYTLSGDDGPGSGISSCYYRVDGSGADPYTSISSGGAFDIPTEGTHTLDFYCEDNSGRVSQMERTTVVTDATAPSSISDLLVDSTTENSVTLTWTAPGNDGISERASKYDLRYQESCSLSSLFDYDTASKVSGVSSPLSPGSDESFDIEGLNPSTDYCFAVKTLDEAPNTSDLSNIVVATTDSSSLPANPGDVVINEMMWGGSGGYAQDEWIELRNITNRTVDISGWYFEKDVSSSPETMYTFPSGSSISPYGFVVIAEYSAANSALKNDPDYIVGTATDNNSDFVLKNDSLEIGLYDDSFNLIDIAWDGTAPTAGIRDTGSGEYYSMERTSYPGDGSDPLSWYTCIDEASTSDFFDGLYDERGTPGAENRSENEPPLHGSTTVREKLVLDYNGSWVSGAVSGVSSSYESYEYEITYGTLNTVEGVVGRGDVVSDSIFIGPIHLGTCSSGGACVYHEGITGLKFSVNLIRQDGTSKSLVEVVE